MVSYREQGLKRTALRHGQEGCRGGDHHVSLPSSTGWILFVHSLRLHFHVQVFLLQQLSGNCEFQMAAVTWP